MKPLIEVRDLHFSYRTGADQSVPILHGLNFDIYPGEFVAIQGPSGSGKSTLLYLLGCMSPIQKGKVVIGDVDVSRLSEDELAIFRNENLGFVFQQFHLLPKASVLDNILLSAHYPIEKPKDLNAATEKAVLLATRLGLQDRLNHGPQELSGGQQQRVAIARALLNEAPVILADEPTGNLDSKSAAIVIDELKALKKNGKTIILITHDKEIAAQADRTIFIQDGKVLTEEKSLISPATSNPILIRKPRLPIMNPATAYLKLIPFASQNIFRNKVRSILTMIGISIGVASVLAMITLGQFAKDRILSSYAELGVNTLSFRGNQNWDQKATDRYGLSFTSFSWERDLLPLKEVFPEIIRITPTQSTYKSVFHFGGKSVEEDGRAVGINEDAFLITGRKVIRGEALSYFHVKNQSPVCVIGAEVAEKLFSNVEPLGEVLRINTDNQSYGCRIIGVAANLNSRNENRNPDLEVYIPYTYFQAVAENWWVARIRETLMKVEDGYDIEKTGKAVQAFFERKYGTSGRFRASADSILIGQMNRFLNIFSIFLASIALISLAVGGIGIANMMLVSVSERYREIGLRKALGATNSSIRQQFLLEAVLLCGIAGVVGLIIGFCGYQAIIWGGSKFIPKFQFEWIVDYQALLLSSVSIIAVGVLSGFIPAVRAEKLSPIEALRSE
ncbi:MAG: ABC transporter permease [Bdellovibrionota bacterium]